MSAFGQAMFDQLQRPNVDISFRMRLVDGQGQDCSCRDFVSLRPEEESLVRDCLADRQEPRILDIGCGIGRHSIFSRSLSPHVRVTVVEVDQQLRDHCISEVPGAVGYGQFNDVPADASFDAVFLLGGGLGIFGDERTTREQLQRLHSLVADGGCVLIESGNPFRNEFHAARHVIEYGDSEDGPFPWGYATRDWLQRELAGVGFETVRIEPSSIGAPCFICHATKKALARTSNDQQSTPEPIAVDPSYRLRDNQFWYNDCAFADTIRDQPAITVRVEGLGVRVLTRANPGKDGRTTYSFLLPNRDDRIWWEEHRGEQVRIELLGVDNDERELPVLQPALDNPVQPPISTEEKAQPSNQTTNERSKLDAERVVLCIGLDIAWFGGSKGKRDSQYDCLAAVLVQPGYDNFVPQLQRVLLDGRDPEAIQLLEAVDIMIQANQSVEQVIFALDAPIQAEVREHFGVRAPAPAAGTVERRACESWFSARRQAIDLEAGGANGWDPKILPGAPLAPRVEHFLGGLVARGFDLWMSDQRAPARLVIECFPAEAIWAMKRMELYPAEMTAAQAKAYKEQEGNHLNGERVQMLVRDVLGAFGTASGDQVRWNGLVNDALAWMLDDETWQTPEGLYRGGKLLDDVVDTMICLATSLSYLRRQAHVWFDLDHANDGHIIGPGFQGDGRWITAWPPEEREATP